MRKTAIAVGLALLAAAPPAHAEVRVERAEVDRIDFAGGAVAYERQRTVVGSANTVVYRRMLMTRVPGRSRRAVRSLGFTAYDRGAGFDEVSQWDVSASSLLVSTVRRTYDGGSVLGDWEVGGGPLRGRLRRFRRCSTESDPPSVAVSARIGAYQDTPCENAHDRIVVRRLDSVGAAPVFAGEAGTGHMDLSGRYLAQDTGFRRALRVFDVRTGRLVLRVDGAFVEDGNGPSAFAVQSDGKLVAISQRRGRCTVAWYSPAEPRPHPIGPSHCASEVHMQGDRVAWIRATKRRRQLAVSDLDGPPRIVASFPAARRYATSVWSRFAFDRGRLAYGVRRCDGRTTLLLRRSLRGPVFRDRDPVTCPMRFPRRRLSMRRGSDRLRVPIRCPRGCAGGWEFVNDYGLDQPLAVRAGGRVARLRIDDVTFNTLQRRGRATLRMRVRRSDRIDRDLPTKRLTFRLRLR